LLQWAIALRWLGLTVWLGVACIACGDAGGADDETDAAAFSDGASSDTFPASDAAPMSVADFRPCGATIECLNPDSACLPVAPLDGVSLCLPRCEVSAECPVDTFCWASTDGPYALLKGRCFWSYCGESFDNGETGGPCRVGAEQGIPWSEQLPGWCYPFHDGIWGLCLELGDLGAGEACDPPEDRCRGDGCKNCGPGTACVAETCREVCDPRLLVEGGTPACPTEHGCRDRSEVHVFDTGLGRGSWGTCEPGTACLTVGEATCPMSSTGQPQGCQPTNPIRPTGFCDERASGTLDPGATCQGDPPAGDEHECAAGTLCVTRASTSTCEPLCDLAETRSPCAGDATCQSILWSIDPAIRTQDWGTCL
jgi:hypothetical protein